MQWDEYFRKRSVVTYVSGLYSQGGCGMKDFLSCTKVGSKKQGMLIYAYDCDGGEIVTYVWGKRDIATVRELEARLNALKLTYRNIAMDK